MANDEASTFVLYHYDPNLIAAAIFCAVFAIGTFAHLFYVFKLKAKYFIPFVIGCLFECIGYAGRAWSHSDKTKLPPYIMQSLLILVAPALFAASIYMVLGRVMRKLEAEQYSMIKPEWLTKVFVVGDIISFFVQSGGAGIQATGNLSSFNTGRNIVIVGLIIQIIVFGFFVVIAVVFHSRLAQRPTHAASDPALGWKKHLYVLYFTSAIILIRNVIRVVEYAQGNDGFIITHEFMLYVFDAAFIFIVVLAFFVIHPSKLLAVQRLHALRSEDSGNFIMTEQQSHSSLHQQPK